MASKQPARSIVKKTVSNKGSVGKSVKMKKEISGSFGMGARHEGTNKSGKKIDMPIIHGYAGELFIEAKLTAQEKTDILGIIRHTAKTGPRDPADQVVEITDTKTGMRIRTIENHLAVAIGKKIDRSHKGGSLTIVWPSNAHLSRVTWKRE